MGNILRNTALAAGIAGVFAAASLVLTRPAPQASVHETGPFRAYERNEQGAFVAGTTPDRAPSQTASVFCFPVHPTAYIAGQQVQTDLTKHVTQLLNRGDDGKVNYSPAPVGVGATLADACRTIKRGGDASDSVNRMARILSL